MELTSKGNEESLYAIQDLTKQDLYIISTALTSLETGVHFMEFKPEKAQYLQRIKQLLAVIKK